jgi:glycine cleavage system H protein
MTVKFTKQHEWIKIEGDTGIVGISDYAQAQLGDVVFVELPKIGKAVSQGGEAAVVESVKAASEVYAPVSGEIIAVNDSLPGNPGTVNQSPLKDGWFFKVKIKNPSEVANLMDEAEYKAYLAAK